MAGLRPELVARCDEFADRVVDVAVALKLPRPLWNLPAQVVDAGTSVGANVAEADEAISRKEFVKCLGIAARELRETRYWLRMIARREWIKASRLSPLQQEAEELAKILAMLIRKPRGD